MGGNHIKTSLVDWSAVLLLACNAAFAVLAWEWLFFATKPSFLSILSLREQIQEFHIAALSVLLACALPCLLLLPIAFRWLRIFHVMGAAYAAALLTPGIVLMLDTVTITLFSWGIRDVKFPLTLLYIAAVLLIFTKLFHIFLLSLQRQSRRSHWRDLIRTIPVVAIVVIGVPMAKPDSKQSIQSVETLKTRSLPNILLFAPDGVSADHLRLYGYDRDTTPHLDAFAQGHALIIENATTNSNVSFSSDLSLLSGKGPATLGVFYPPQSLIGKDAFQHLPGLLKHLGYRTFQSSSRHYADAYMAGIKFAFDQANERSAAGQPEQLLQLVGHPGAGILLNEVFDRIRTRALQLTGHSTLDQEFAEMTGKPELSFYSLDNIRRDDFLTFLNEAEEPFFAHVHLMSTHCCQYQRGTPFFAAEVVADEATNTRNRFDDTIRATDEIFETILSALQARDQLDNTIIVYSSDHAENWTTTQRVPLLFRFPHGSFSGTRKHNAQLIDVAPTILDYLGLPIPEWMEGVSLLRQEPPPYRQTYMLSGLMPQHSEPRIGLPSVLQLNDIGPPFYGVQSFMLKVCNRWYDYNLHTQNITSGEIPNYTFRCEATKDIPDLEQARLLITQYLQRRGIGV